MGYTWGSATPDVNILRVPALRGFDTFGEAKSALLKCLREKRDEYNDGIRRIKRLTREQADANPYSVKGR